jgi:hypothetical protein
MTPRVAREDDPSHGVERPILVNPTKTRGLLLCELDGGMEQGEVRFYTSSDAGHRWRLLEPAN